MTSNQSKTLGKALFLGRFQPFHNGHLKDLLLLAKKFDEVIVVIGSKQESKTADNPYSFRQREKMIELIITEYNLMNVKIVGVDDIGDNEKYVAHVEKQIPKCDVFISGNELTLRLFKQAGYKVKELPRYWELSATDIREKKKKKEKWKHLVPNVVYEYLMELRDP